MTRRSGPADPVTARRPDGAWQPVSDCGPGCLPAPGEQPGVTPLRAAARLGALLVALGLGVGLVGVLPLLPSGARGAAGRAWARTVAGALGITVVVRGRALRAGGALLVANHSSWLDVVALLAVAPTRLLAKREVRRWPLVGPLATVAGTVFLDRRRLRTLPRTVGKVAAALRAGRPVAVFPEGTTWCGRSTGGFRPALFQAAIDATVPVVPVRIAYHCAVTGAETTVAGFLGDESLWRSVRRVLSSRDLTITVTVLAALHPAAGADRRRLAGVAESALRLRAPGGRVGPVRAADCPDTGRGGLVLSRCIALA